MNSRQLTPPLLLTLGSRSHSMRATAQSFSVCLLVAVSYLFYGPERLYVATYFNLIGLIMLFLWLHNDLIASHGLGSSGGLTGKFTFLCIFGYCSLFIGHAVANKFGVGYGIGGGRETVSAIIVVSFAFLLLSGRLGLGKPQLIPLCGLVVGFFLGGLDVLNYFFPALYPLLRSIYPNFNWEVDAAQASFNFEVSRLCGLREIGYFLALFAVCHMYFKKGRKNIFYIILLLVSIVLVLLSGYRSYFLAILVMMALLFLRKLGLAARVIIIVGMVVLTSVNVRALPDSIQRTLSFLPGDWQAESVEGALGGVEWREMNIDLFMLYKFWDRPWLGAGVTGYFFEGTPGERENYDYVETQTLHSGIFSTLDYVGIIGLVFLILATIRAYMNCFYLISNDKFLTPWMLWVILFYVSIQSWFWVTGFFALQFIQISVCMIMLEKIRREVESIKLATSPLMIT